MVKRQVVVGPGAGLVGAVRWVVERGLGRGRLLLTAYRLSRDWGKGRVKLLYLGQRCEWATLMLHQGRSRVGCCSDI